MHYICFLNMVSLQVEKMDDCFFRQTLRQNMSWCLSQHGKTLLKFHFTANRKSIGSSKKQLLGIFEIDPRLGDWHTFIWQPLETLNIFITLTSKKSSEKQKGILKNWSMAFYLKVLPWKTSQIHTKLLFEKPMLTQKMVSKKLTHQTKSWICD